MLRCAEGCGAGGVRVAGLRVRRHTLRPLRGGGSRESAGYVERLEPVHHEPGRREEASSDGGLQQISRNEGQPTNAQRLGQPDPERHHQPRQTTSEDDEASCLKRQERCPGSAIRAPLGHPAHECRGEDEAHQVASCRSADMLPAALASRVEGETQGTEEDVENESVHPAARAQRRADQGHAEGLEGDRDRREAQRILTCASTATRSAPPTTKTARRKRTSGKTASTSTADEAEGVVRVTTGSSGARPESRARRLTAPGWFDGDVASTWARCVCRPGIRGGPRGCGPGLGESDYFLVLPNSQNGSDGLDPAKHEVV